MFFWWFEKRFFSESRVMCGFGDVLAVVFWLFLWC